MTLDNDSVRLEDYIGQDNPDWIGVNRLISNTPERTMPGIVFLHGNKQYVMTGQHSNGKYYRAYDQEKRNFPAAKVRLLTQNTRLVFVAYFNVNSMTA